MVEVFLNGKNEEGAGYESGIGVLTFAARISKPWPVLYFTKCSLININYGDNLLERDIIVEFK